MSAKPMGTNGGSVVSGGAGPGGGCQCGGDPAGGAQAGPDRDCIGHPWAGGPGSKTAGAAVGVRRERARYEAERARRQYDAVEPENRLVARSLERVWEEKLRVVEGIEQDYDRWRREQPLVLSDDDRDALRALGQNLPQVWHAITTTAADRKRILRFIIRDVILDQTKLKGHVWLKIAGKPVQPASILCSAVFTPTTTTPISISCGRDHAAECRRHDGQGGCAGSQSGRLQGGVWLSLPR